jgi:hypothetical protein
LKHARGTGRRLLLAATAGVLSAATCLLAPTQNDHRRPHPLGAGGAEPTAAAPPLCPARTPVPVADGGAGTADRLLTHFAAIGDYGINSDGERQVAALVKSWAPDFVITLGDNNYPSGGADTIDTNIGQFFHELIGGYSGHYGCAPRDNQFFPALGNHDLLTAAGKPYFDYFQLPGNERYYDFVRGAVHLFAIDSDGSEPDGNTATSAQAMWLKAKLAASTTRWQVVYMHHPPYSSGAHGSTAELQWPFAAWGADLVLSGHDHMYERIVADGITYVVNGLGGAANYAFNTPVPGSTARYTDGFGAMLIDADASRLRLRFIGTAGNVIDEAVLGAGAP